MKRVVVRPAAAADILEAHEWYEKQSAGLGEQLLVALTDTLARIVEHPEAFPVLYRSTRRALVPHRFPYGIFYRLVDDAIVVVAIMHASRDPSAWRRRLP
ncbi:MAG: type II toxin-antitoxin system RelE/ParE family toxin [Chloroflexi bacterium]|nr:type II toxin-antitoxin system RelE/ParE family toxin [Chloroflexota bacterium]